MSRKYQNWIEDEASANFSLKNLIFGNSSDDLRKTRYQRFLVLSEFACFSYFMKNILKLIAGSLMEVQGDKLDYLT